MASVDGITVQVTPLSAESKGLAVVAKSLDGIVVQELQNGAGSYSFDFTVTAVRQDQENHQVLRGSTATGSIDSGVNASHHAVIPDEHKGND